MKKKKSKIDEYLSMEGNFISGVHNYCDRWCERCIMSDHCRVAAREKIKPHNDDSWMEELQETFSDIHEMLAETMEEQGIDYETFKAEALAEAEANPEEEIDWHEHELARQAHNYQQNARAFFDKHADVFENKEKELNQMIDIGMNQKQIEHDAIVIKDCFEVINWYMFFMEVKLIRALSSRHDEKDDADAADYPLDSNGSCKVSLLAMDSTIDAWEKLLNLFAELADEMVDILSQLNALRNAVEKEFPNARSFVRAGFDTGGK